MPHTPLRARYPFSRESTVEAFLSDESYHRLLCNFLHGSLTKNSGLPNIKYIQKLDNSNFLLSALKCRIVWSVSQTRSSLSSAVISLNPELILRKKKQEQQIPNNLELSLKTSKRAIVAGVSVFLRSAQHSELFQQTIICGYTL